MTNIFIEESIYISVLDFKESSFGSLKNESDDIIKMYIVKSQILIDDLIKDFDIKLNSSQKYIFPTLNYGIPLDIKKATTLLSENLFINKDKKENITQEKRGQNSVTYSSIQSKYENNNINDETYLYLKKYIKIDKSKTLFFRS